MFLKKLFILLEAYFYYESRVFNFIRMALKTSHWWIWIWSDGCCEVFGNFVCIYQRYSLVTNLDKMTCKQWSDIKKNRNWQIMSHFLINESFSFCLKIKLARKTTCGKKTKKSYTDFDPWNKKDNRMFIYSFQKPRWKLKHSNQCSEC